MDVEDPIVIDTKTVNKLRCPYCNYEWVPRVSKPKECPNCKKRFQLEDEE